MRQIETGQESARLGGIELVEESYVVLHGLPILEVLVHLQQDINNFL